MATSVPYLQMPASSPPAMQEQPELRVTSSSISTLTLIPVTWARYARVVGLDSARAHLMVNSMHGASHDLGCQLKNNGRYLATAAWRVGEQTEQLWSMFIRRCLYRVHQV
ncbi:hypothetical protein V8C86DRAFT_1183887 [Haematococcus lacustris]